MATIIKCDICNEVVDKTEQTKGFGAMSIIMKQYTFTKSGKVGEQNLVKTDFDICAECCDKISKFIEESKKEITNKKETQKVEQK